MSTWGIWKTLENIRITSLQIHPTHTFQNTTMNPHENALLWQFSKKYG